LVERVRLDQHRLCAAQSRDAIADRRRADDRPVRRGRGALRLRSRLSGDPRQRCVHELQRRTARAVADRHPRLLPPMRHRRAAGRDRALDRHRRRSPMLTDFGVRLMGRMTEPTTLALAPVVIAAAEKFPNIGRAFYEAGPLYGATRLAAELENLQKLGALKVPDPERAAWQFVDLCQSYVYKRLLFGVVDSISREDIEASVEAGVDVFLKAYGVSG